MVTTIQKWDTSLGAGVPKTILSSPGIRENDKVKIQDQGNRILNKNALTDLDILFEGCEKFDGCEKNETCAKFDFGEDMGAERVW